MGSHPLDPDPATDPAAPWPTWRQWAALAAFVAAFAVPVAAVCLAVTS